MNAVTETKIERTENKVLSFEEWGAKVRAAAAEVIAWNVTVAAPAAVSATSTVMANLSSSPTPTSRAWERSMVLVETAEAVTA